MVQTVQLPKDNNGTCVLTHVLCQSGDYVQVVQGLVRAMTGHAVHIDKTRLPPPPKSRLPRVSGRYFILVSGATIHVLMAHVRRLGGQGKASCLQVEVGWTWAAYRVGGWSGVGWRMVTVSWRVETERGSKGGNGKECNGRAGEEDGK